MKWGVLEISLLRKDSRYSSGVNLPLYLCISPYSLGTLYMDPKLFVVRSAMIDDQITATEY